MRGGGVVVWARRLLVALGTAMLGYGVYGAVGAGEFGLAPYRNFLAASLLWPTLLGVPVALGLGALVARLVPGTVRAPVQAALFTTGVVLVVALPLVLGTGHDPTLPSALPRAYGWGLALVLGLVWTGALAWAALRLRAAFAASRR
ncbi:hypothetical protein [Streptomyces sp. NPDC048172]|uniref:hypothetical protein n=1 Tax=Streptomyces sp. NPDC048172 TaxID=3365505 RepID=UPI0037112166